MKFRRTKSLILICLIVSSIFLSAYVWFSEELWPRGYNFFIMFQNNPAVRRIFNSDIYSIPKENLSKPQKIVVTKGEKRNVYYNSNPSFDTINQATSAFISTVLKDETSIKNRVVVNKDEWHNVLRNDEILDTNSIYINYSLECSPSLFAHMIGIKDTWIGAELGSVKEFIIAPVSEDILFYAKNGSDDTIYKYLVSYPKKDEISSIINNYTIDAGTTYSYSFELNLDKNEGGIGSGVKQKVFIDSMVIVSSDSISVPVIYGENPFETEIADRQKLLELFQYAAGAPKHYTDYSGVEYFVENYSHFKIHPNGLIEFNAETEGGGISLPDNPVTVYEALNKSIEFSENVWQSVVGEKPFSVLVTSDLLENDQGIYKFTLDYYYEGNLVTTSLKGENFEPMNFAVEIYVKNGKIEKYRHFFRRYEKADTIVCTPQIQALDKIYEKLQDGENEIFIKDVYLSYIENGDKTDKAPVWCAEIKGTNEIVY